MSDKVGREGVCDLCGVDYPCWSADSDLWNAVVRRPDGSDRWPFLCPTCFMTKAAGAGVETLFRVTRPSPFEASDRALWTEHLHDEAVVRGGLVMTEALADALADLLGTSPDLWWGLAADDFAAVVDDIEREAA